MLNIVTTVIYSFAKREYLAARQVNSIESNENQLAQDFWLKVIMDQCL